MAKPVITSSLTSPTTTSPIPVTVNFGEVVTGFTLFDVTLSNAIIDQRSFEEGDNGLYTFNILPYYEGEVRINIAEGAAQDIALVNTEAADEFTITYQGTVDSKNALRVDIPQIFEEIQEQCAHNLDSTTYPEERWDRLSINESDQNRIWIFIEEASADIANNAHMIKHHEQTGLDALTYYEVLECPEDFDTDGDREVTGPDQTPINLNDIPGRIHFEQQKLDASATMQQVSLFSVDGLEPTEKNRYTIVQTFIKQALVHYVLMKWWMMKMQPTLAESNQMMYNNALQNIIHNAIHNQKRKGVRTKMRPTIF